MGGFVRLRREGAERIPRGRPVVVIAHTVKGKGVSFMENQAGWHGVPTTKREQLEKEMAELENEGVPLYPLPQRAVRALKGLMEYGEVRKKLAQDNG